jgi:hypothetical protein
VVPFYGGKKAVFAAHQAARLLLTASMRFAAAGANDGVS